MDVLDIADKLGSKKIRRMAINYLVEHFDILQGDMGNALYALDKEVLVEIIKARALRDYHEL